MTFKPAHKDNTAGQIRNEITLGDYIANKSRHEAFNTVKEECCGNPLRGCKDCPPQRKLTFDEYLLSLAKREDGTYPYGYDVTRPRDFIALGTVPALLERVWNAAQENK